MVSGQHAREFVTEVNLFAIHDGGLPSHTCKIMIIITLPPTYFSFPLPS